MRRVSPHLAPPSLQHLGHRRSVQNGLLVDPDNGRNVEHSGCYRPSSSPPQPRVRWSSFPEGVSWLEVKRHCSGKTTQGGTLGRFREPLTRRANIHEYFLFMTGDMVVKRKKASNGARGGIALSARACATKPPTEVRARGMYLHTVALIRPPPVK